MRVEAFRTMTEGYGTSREKDIIDFLKWHLVLFRHSARPWATGRSTQFLVVSGDVFRHQDDGISSPVVINGMPHRRHGSA